jgi:argininosuccinate lyase
VRRFAWDLSLYTTAEFGFVKLPSAYTTGSSLMPNKKNPDVVELLRAASAVVTGARTEIAGTLSLPSGYHRDLQATKGPLLRAMRRGLAALALVPRLVENLIIDGERTRAAITADMFATDRALELARAGTPFRDAYRAVARDVEAVGTHTVDASLAARTSPGATGDLRLAELRGRFEVIRGRIVQEGTF